MAGLLIGFIASAITAYPLSLLPKPFGSIMPFVALVLFGYLFSILLASRNEDIVAALRSFNDRRPLRGKDGSGANARKILVDTSAIIDGRIVDIAETGFLGGSLIIPVLCSMSCSLYRILPTAYAVNVADVVSKR